MMNLTSAITVTILKTKFVILKNTCQDHQRKRYFRCLIRELKSLIQKADLGYTPKGISKFFENLFKAKNIFHYKILKHNYCNKEGHIAIFYFIKP